MKMNECTSRTWTKIAEIPTDDFSIDGITRAINKEFGEPFTEDIAEAIADDFSIKGIARSINNEFGEPFIEDVVNAIAEGYIQVCEDGIIVWCS